MSLMLGLAVSSAAMADTAYYVKPTESSSVPSGKTEWTGQELGADHLWFAYDNSQINVTENMTVDTGTGQLWVGPTGEANGTMTISGDITGSGKIVLNTWASSNTADLFEITGDATGFSGTVAIERASGGGWGQLNLTGSTLSNSVIGQSNGSNSILNIGGATSIKGINTSSTFRVTSTNAANVLTLNVTADATSGATIGAVTNNTYFEAVNTLETTASKDLSIVKRGGSTQTFSGTVTLKDLDVQQGALVFSGTAKVTGTTKSNGTLKSTGGTLTLANVAADTIGTLCAEGGNVTLQNGTATLNNLWIKKGNSVLLTENSQLWAGAVKIIGKDNTSAVGISNASTNTNGQKYEATNTNFELSNVTLLSRTDGWAASELKNVLTNVVVDNVRDNFKITWNSANSLVSTTARANTNFVNAGENGITLNTLTLANGKVVGVYKDTTTDAGDNDANIGDVTISSLVMSGTTGTLNGNLIVANGGTMDFSAGGILTMGCTVEIGDDVKVYITGDADAIRHGEAVTIIDSVDDVAILGNAEIYVNNTLQNDFSLKQFGDKIVVAPEPATATLSLLALAALASRRKRH